ncbi:MAG: hypothetical protein CfP315_0218 [Candidatus Improbicoccus pseudotrichonymphae]|uniref:Uncharacterized protein n=1 Tax=Candidatus Improbicoccus pseudotrichonymphae TaxID=3033792 RepID=A0AA48KVA5_9FIRM|nr:MAG: hypothetical protein CfP315_0218 [Candidatus Improbicoccus pseudotrichonymphae]
MIFLSDVCLTAFAGGVDKEETLSDGTKLIYISTERIPEVLDCYTQAERELLNRRYSTKQSFEAKSAAVTVGSAGLWIFSKIGDTCPDLALFGGAVTLVGSLILFFYPNYVDYKLGREYCGWDDRASHQCWLTGYGPQWGPSESRNEGFGIDGICRGLHSHYYEHGTWNPKITDTTSDSGVVVVLRPKSKWNPSSNTTFRSGVFGQCEFHKGLLLLLIDAIERGE